MGPSSSLEYNKMMSNSLLQQLDAKSIPASLAKIFDAQIREQFPQFVGIKSPNLPEQLLADEKHTGNLRKHFANTMNESLYRNSGVFPDVVETRVAISSPTMMNAQLGSGGSSFGLMDPSGKIIGEEALNPHDTYKAKSAGEYMGGFGGARLKVQELFPTYFEERSLLGTPAPEDKISSTDWYSFGRRMPTQRYDQEWLDKVMPIYEKRMKEMTGKKKGGLAHMSGGGTPEPKRKSILDLTPLTEAAAAVQNAFKAESRTSGDKGATMDIINRGQIAPFMGAAVDIPQMALEGIDWLQSKIPGLRKPASVMDTKNPIPQRQDPTMGYVPKFPLATDEPFGGTAHAQRLMREANITSGTERPMMEAMAGMAAPFAPAVASKAAKVAKAVAPRAGDLAYQFINKQAEAMGLPLEMGVVKTKGGNWLAGESERLTKPMKSYVPTEESLLRAEAVTPVGAAEARASSIPNAVLNKWIDKKLNSYIKNEMGTPEDQIRLGIERRAAEAEKLRETNQVRLDKMAADIERNKAAGKDTTLTERDLEAAKDKFDEEYQIASQGLYHGTVPEGGWMGGNVWEPQALAYKREKEGFPEGGMGKHPAAIDWEAKSDAEIHSTPAGQFVGDGMPESYYDRTNSLAKDYNQKVLDQNPWLSKVDPETKVYKLDEMNPDVGLEFRHMIDEVKTAMDPASNLPKHLKIAAKDLEKMTVDDVSALSGKISAWRNAQIGKPNLELANNPAVSLYKEYPTANNPKGVSWRQIKRPEGLPDEEADKALRDAIGYEGDIMRHCVGGSGHCEPLLRGETEVYSLRDAKGEPHVTIEVEPAEHPYEIDMKKLDGTTGAQYGEYVRQWRRRNPDVEEMTDENVYQALKEAGVPPAPSSIVEIKGKNNRKPKDEYIPFIQDFIKSGNWSNVGDLHHTDLHKVGSEYFTEPEFIELAKKYGRMGIQDTTWEVARQRHIDQGVSEEEALLNWVEGFKEGRGRFAMPPKSRPEGMKRGGAVRMAEGGEVPKAPSNWTDYLSQHAQEESMRLMGGDTALNPMKDGGSIDDMIRNAVEKANSRNYASGGASLKNIESEEGLAPYGLRHSGEGAKGKGYFGVMPGKRGMVTELSTEAEGVGEHPLIVPTLTREELEYLLAGGDPTEPIYQKAYKHAQGRKSKGKGAFADPSELRHPEPEYADGGVVNIDDLIRKAVTIRNQNA